MDLKTCFSGGAEESIHFMIFFAELLKTDPSQNTIVGGGA